MWRTAERVNVLLQRVLTRRAPRVKGQVGVPSAPSGRLPVGALDCVIASNEYGLYCLPKSALHRPAAHVVLRAQVWEPDTVELLRRVDPSADIVHAGTFFGDFLPALVRSRAERATVWAFEPNLESYRCARVTILINDLNRVVLTHAALGRESGETALLATRSADGIALGGGSYLVHDAVESIAAAEEVSVVAIDDSVPGDRLVGAIHLDVEGEEKSALEGALQTIRRCRPLLILEVLPDSSWMEARLSPLGYKATGCVHTNTVLAADRRVGA